MQLLIDADPIVYRVGFASQKPSVQGVVEYPDGTVRTVNFQPKQGATANAQLNAWLEKHPDVELLFKEERPKPEPVDHVQFGIRDTVRAIVDRVAKEYPQTPVESHVLLTGKGNYRDAIAKAAPYKGNRTKAKPVHYDMIREYLISEYGARVIEGQEADDEVAILATQYGRAKTHYVIATIDKDLDQIEGSHFDYRLNVFYFVSRQEARARFWIQTLCGDATDNIPGLDGVGFKTAEKIIRPLLDAGATDKDVWRAVLDEYKDDAEHALETARLVYLRREQGELWNPPTT